MQQERSRTTHARILESALVCFSRAGYDAASVAMICQHAHVSKGAFYHHFPSKQALFLDLLQRWLDSLDARLHAIQSTPGSNPGDLETMASEAGQLFAQAGGQFTMYMEFLQRAARDPVIWKRSMEPFHRYQELFTSHIQTGIQAGRYKNFPPETTSRAIVALAVGLLLQAALEPNRENWAEVMRDCIKLLLTGIQTTQEEQDS